MDKNAKLALNQMKMEIAGELGIDTNIENGATKTSYENGKVGGELGGVMSKELVNMGKQALLRQYNNNKF